MPAGVITASIIRALEEEDPRASTVVQGLRLRASTAGGTGLIPGQGIKIPQACSRAKKKEREKEAYIGISACELVEVGVVVVRANLERSSGLVVSLTPPFTTREAKNPTKGRMCLSAQGKLVPC